MTEDDGLPLIGADFDLPAVNSNNKLYLSFVRNTLRQLLPDHCMELYRQGPQAYAELHAYFQTLLPLSLWSITEDVPANLSFYILSQCRQGGFNFFYEMFSRWLVPGGRLDVVVVCCADFSLPELGDEVYMLTEVVVHVKSKEELEAIQHNLPIIETEVCLGITSSYHARKILEIKGLSNDSKTAMIQEYIAHLSSRWSSNFSNDVFTEMQHVLVMCQDDFKAAREVLHLSRIICIQYLFRKHLRKAVKSVPKKRHLCLKIFRAKLHLPDESKTVLGIIVAVNFLHDKEIFEEAHLIKAIRNYVPTARAVPNSFFYNRRGNEPICTLYLDVEKTSGELFTNDELKLLRTELPEDLEGRIEHLQHPVFMPRNEEEVMRNILTLSSQIKYLRDIPQMFITFDEQTYLHLFFTVILVRVIRTDSLSVQEMFRNAKTFLDYMHDRCKTIGHIRKKYRKEATVFRIKVTKEQFLRRDHSIDLYKARQSVVSEISHVLGEVRDYNGGMISKQNELLANVKELLKGTEKYHDLLLENFFYSLNPVIMRTVLEPEALKKLFLMLLRAVSEGFAKDDSYSMLVRAEPNFVYVMIGAEDRKVEKEVAAALETMMIPSSALATSCVYVYNLPYFGYIYRSDDPEKQRKFCVKIQHAVEACQHQTS